MRKSSGANPPIGGIVISPLAWMSHIIKPAAADASVCEGKAAAVVAPAPTVAGPASPTPATAAPAHGAPVADAPAAPVSKSVSWHDMNEKQIEERDLYNELLRRLSVNTSARDELLFLFLQIFCAENQNFDFKDLAPRVDEAFSMWVDENLKTNEPLLLGDSCACIRLARLERKLSHVLCLLTLMIKATVDPDIETLSHEVIARGFVTDSDDDDDVTSSAAGGGVGGVASRVFDHLLQLLLALWSQISAVKLQIATHYNKASSSIVDNTPAKFNNFNSTEALRLIVTKLPPT